MRCCIYVYTYVIRQYEFSNNYKAKMVLLPRGICRIRVKGFLSAISLWHELNNKSYARLVEKLSRSFYEKHLEVFTFE